MAPLIFEPFLATTAELVPNPLTVDPSKIVTSSKTLGVAGRVTVIVFVSVLRAT